MFNLNVIRQANLFVRLMTGTVIVTFFNLVMSPTAFAITQDYRANQMAQSIEQLEASSNRLFSRTLHKIKTTVGKLAKKSLTTEKQEKLLKKVFRLNEKVKQLKASKLQVLESERDRLVERNLPDEIIQRHDSFVATFLERYDQYINKINAIEAEIDLQQKDLLIESFHEFLSQYQFKRIPQPFDPKNFSNDKRSKKLRKPARDKSEFKSLGLYNERSLAAPQQSLMRIRRTTYAPPSTYLEFNQEIQTNEAIQNLADSLGNNPVEIFNWVRNNIDFLPTYGSIQGAQMTLESKQGNAYDTASLLIALLRSANIHARYTYGTVEIPIEKVMNWVGGVSSPYAALNLLGEGGIPATGITQNGILKTIRMEHTWVEAWVDYMPSRGAKHITGDTWLAMDPSFKQYQYHHGIDSEADQFSETKSEIEKVLNTVTINDNYIQGIDADMFRNMLLLGEQNINTYLDENPDSDFHRSIEPIDWPILTSGLPYALVEKAYTADVLPDSASHSLTYQLFTDAQQQAMGNFDFQFQAKYSELIGQELKLGFIPASPADQEALASYFPNIEDGATITQDMLPQSIPGYLIYMKPVLTLNGDTVAQGSAVPIGQELVSSIRMKRLSGSSQVMTNRFIAGESQVIKLAAGVQPVAKDIVNVVDRNPQNVLKNIATSYFGHLHYATSALNLLNQTVSYQHPSIGTFSTELVPEYWFGLPRNVSFGSMRVDLDMVEYSHVSRDNNPEQERKVMQALGMVSSMLEGEIPAIFGSTKTEEATPISSMHVLATAMYSGMRIYTIDNNNPANIDLLNVDESVKTDIENAIHAGKQVLIPQSNVLIGDWVGVGYIIQDNSTGAGIYRISGGINGGSVSRTEVTLALAAIGLDNNLFINAVIPTANADYGSCEKDKDGNDSNNISIDWFTMLVIILLLMFLTALIIAGGVIGAAAAAMIAVFIPLNAAAAAGKGCPIFVSGNYNPDPTSLKRMDEATTHTASAIKPGETDELTYLGPKKHIGWYTKYDECNRKKYGRDGIEEQCDEYPFQSTLEGGKLNYPKWVSLKLIRAAHNRVQGGMLSTFYSQCGIGRGDRFKVETSSGPTLKLDENRQPCSRGSRVKNYPTE